MRIIKIQCRLTHGSKQRSIHAIAFIRLGGNLIAGLLETPLTTQITTSAHYRISLQTHPFFVNNLSKLFLNIHIKIRQFDWPRAVQFFLT